MISKETIEMREKGPQEELVERKREIIIYNLMTQAQIHINNGNACSTQIEF